MNHSLDNRMPGFVVCGLVALGLVAGPLPGWGDTSQSTAILPCTPESGLPLVEADGMNWFPEGYTTDKLALMGPTEMADYAGVWADAYEAMGVDRVVLSTLARDLSSWGAVEPEGGRSYGRYQMEVLDAVIRAFRGKAVVVLSSENPWDHEDMGLPTDRTSFSEYARAVVERYDGDMDFGSLTDPSYPDINYSGVVNTADWEATPDEKQAWADAHRVHAYMVEGELPEDPGDYYTTVLEDVLAAALKADKTVQVWIAPIPLGAFGKAKLTGWLGPFAGDAGPADGLASILATLPFEPYDITAQAGMEDLEDLGTWLGELGFKPGDPDGVELILGGLRPGYGLPACPSPQCDDRSQTENLVKALSLAAVNGADAVSFDGLLEDPDDPTGFALATMNPLDSPPLLDLRPALPAVPMLARILGGADAPVRINTPVTSTQVVQGTPCDGVIATVVWYDWTLEVGKDKPYGDLSKALEIDLVPALSRAFPLDIPDPEPQALDAGDLMAATLSESNLIPLDEGGFRLTIGREPVLVMTLEDGWGVAEATETAPEAVEEIPVPDQAETDDDAGGGGSCAAGFGNTPGGPVVLAGLMALLLFRFRRVRP